MFCTRTRLVLGWLKVPYEPVVYGYGQGADPAKNAGYGYDPEGGPVPLTGKKKLPVLEGLGVPTSDGTRGMAESLEICSYAVAIAEKSGRHIAPATGRSDVNEWFARCRATGSQLHRPRIVNMPVADFADQRDIEYSRHSHVKSGFDYEASLAKTPELLKDISAILAELEPMLRGTTQEGTPCLNVWGFSIDDAIILGYMRNLTCVKGIDWPAKVRSYVDDTCAKAGIAVYSEHAC